MAESPFQIMEPAEFREHCAVRLLVSVERVSQLQAFVGLDGFVDEICHVVDKRDRPDSFQRLDTISQLGARISSAAGQSTNIELVNQRTKLGGNGPIMANALARLGIKVTYVGALGYPVMHPVFNEFARRAEVHSIAEPGHTDALEFDDGKLMFGKTQQLADVTWEKIQARFGRDRFIEKFSTAQLVAFVNWTMVPYMSDLWAGLLREFCPTGLVSGGERRKLFFDLADPEKRTRPDISEALRLISQFENYFEVILGVNQKEAFELGKVLGLKLGDESPDGLIRLGHGIQERVPISSLVIHPTSYALVVSAKEACYVDGPFVEKPVITTGAGDHFNAGFCLGKLIGLSNMASLLTGVSASGYYVSTGQTPGIEELAALLRSWPERER